MARKCNSRGCGFYLPDGYPLDKCPWHMAPGSGPVKIAAALAIAAAGFGGGFAYKKFRRYLDEKKLRKERETSRKRQGPRRNSQKPNRLRANGAPLKSGRAHGKNPRRSRSGNRLNRRLARTCPRLFKSAARVDNFPQRFTQVAASIHPQISAVTASWSLTMSSICSVRGPRDR